MPVQTVMHFFNFILRQFPEMLRKIEKRNVLLHGPFLKLLFNSCFLRCPFGFDHRAQTLLETTKLFIILHGVGGTGGGIVLSVAKVGNVIQKKEGKNEGKNNKKAIKKYLFHLTTKWTLIFEVGFVLGGRNR